MEFAEERVVTHKNRVDAGTKVDTDYYSLNKIDECKHQETEKYKTHYNIHRRTVV